MKVLIWGTGHVAEQVTNMGINGEILGYVRSGNVENELYKSKRVFSENNLPEYDAIVVANTFCDEIYELLSSKGIDLKNIIFFDKCRYDKPENNLIFAEQIFSPQGYNAYLANKGLIDHSFFVHDAEEYRQKNIRSSFDIRDEYLHPIITDKYDDMGKTDDSFWESTWAARKIIRRKPSFHYDIGLRLNGFLSILIAADIKLKVIDIREFPVEIQGMQTVVDDATKLSRFADNSIESISALDSIAHFGLGRYGDPIDPEACFTCFKSIQKKLKKGGILYLSVPLGDERVCFNAHRVFAIETIMSEFSNMKLLSMATVSNNHIDEDTSLEKYEIKRNVMVRGLFEFMKQ